MNDAGEGNLLAFAERLFLLLDEGKRTSTYKFAVLLGLIDLCLEHSTETGAAPTSVTTRQLARKVTALYWPHTTPFAAIGESRVLNQNKGGQGEILQWIEKCRDGLPEGPGLSYGSARARYAERIEKLERRVEWKLIEMPLPRLQLIGGNQERVIYRIGWNIHQIPSPKEVADGTGFSNNIIFVPGASEHLVRLAPLLRPFVQKQWAAMVSQLNNLPDAGLERHLFGRDRISLAAVAEPLRDLQNGVCLYCGRALGRAVMQVDHFIPWSRHPDDGLENLVAAHEGCNGDKRDFLASAKHVRTWRKRNVLRAPHLAQIAETLQWEREAEQTDATARAIYLRLSPEVRLWHTKREFVEADHAELRNIFQ